MWQRVWGLFLKNLYLARSSVPRQTQFVFWPMIDIFIWGFMATALGSSTSWGGQVLGVILSCIILGNFFFNIQVGMCMPYMEELWGRTFGHIMVSPVKSPEIALAFTLIGLFRCSIGIGVALLVAYILFHFSILPTAIYFARYFIVLTIFGAGLGLMIASVLTRYGMGADFLVWVLAATLAPLSGLVYPVEILPLVFQKLSVIFPTTYVFTGMREVLLKGVFNWEGFYTGLWLSGAYLLLGFFVFSYALVAARKSGRIMSIAAE